MAEYYGACTGNAGERYNVWMSVIQNYQGIETNSSNISVALYLKRNDGVSDSAYNLNDWENAAAITVNGDTKIVRNLDIDTRGNATVTLVEWTGDVFHNADGSLYLNVYGNFVMGNSSLTGGSVSAGFSCSVIPRASYMSFDVSEACPGGNIICNVSSASSEFSHSVNFYLEKEEGSIWLSEGVLSGCFTVPVEWAGQLPWATSASISVVLTTYYYGQYVGSNTYSIKLTIPDTIDFKPTFDLVVEQVDNGEPKDWNVYLKGVSGVKVDVANLDLKYGAVAISCETKVGNLTANAVPSWFYLLDSGNVEISVCIRDSRGFTYTASTTIFVTDYFAPSLTVNSIKRCNAQGELTETGAYLLLDYKVNFCNVDGKNEVGITCKCRHSSGDWGEESLLQGSPAIVGEGSIIPASSYVLQLRVYDWITRQGVTIDRSVPSIDIPFNIRKGGKGAAFGCYAENDDELTVGWDLNIKGKIKSNNIQFIATDKVSLINGTSSVRCYPSLDTCFINLSIAALVDIPADTDFVLGYVEIDPVDYSPLCVVAEQYKGCRVCIDSQTKAIVFRSDDYIPMGTGIYINGFYTIKQEE